MAGVTAGTNILLLSSPAQHTSEPALTALSATTFVAVWNESQPGTGATTAKGQAFSIINGAFAKIGGEFLIGTRSEGQSDPSVVAVSSTTFAIAWTDTNANADIRTQLYSLSANGVTRLGADQIAHSITTNDQSAAALASLSSSTLVVVWTDRASTADDSSSGGIRAQLFSTTSGVLTKLGVDFAVNTQTREAQRAPQVVALSPSRFVVVWQDDGGSGVNGDIYNVKGQVFSVVSGVASKLGSEFLVNTTTQDNQMRPAITALNATDFVVAWEDTSGVNARPSFVSVKGQVFSTENDTLTRVGGEFLTHSPYLPDQVSPAIATMSPTGFMAVSVNIYEEVTGQSFLIGSGGQAVNFDNNFRMPATSLAHERDPTAIGVGPDRVLIAWAEFSSFGTTAQTGIRMQLVYLNDEVRPRFEPIMRVDPQSQLAQAHTVTVVDGSTVANPAYEAVATLNKITADLSWGQITLDQANAALRHLPDTTTSVATLAYQFFTGKTPTAAGYDYLVNSTANSGDLNDPYYAKFNLENRYINFAVNLGKLGEGAARFRGDYDGLSLTQATSKAYTVIFGSDPGAAKVEAILTGPVQIGGEIRTRADYFAAYGLDGPNGLGTKAAMVGFLMAEAIKADAGVYAAANARFLIDLFDGTASFNVDLLTAYGPAKSGPDIGLVGAAADWSGDFFG